MPGLNSIPQVIVDSKIVPYLTAADVCNASLACTSWNSVFDRNSVWYTMLRRDVLHADRYNKQKVEDVVTKLPIAESAKLLNEINNVQPIWKKTAPAITALKKQDVLYDGCTLDWKDEYKNCGLLEKQQLKEVIVAHKDEVLFVKFSHDGNYLCTMSRDQTAMIWRMRVTPDTCCADIVSVITMKGIGTYCQWSNDDKYVLVQSRDTKSNTGIVTVVEVASGAVLTRIFQDPGDVCAVWLPGSKHAFVTCTLELISDRYMRLPLWTITKPKGQSKSVVISTGRSFEISLEEDWLWPHFLLFKCTVDKPSKLMLVHEIGSQCKLMMFRWYDMPEELLENDERDLLLLPTSSSYGRLSTSDGDTTSNSSVNGDSGGSSGDEGKSNITVQFTDVSASETSSPLGPSSTASPRSSRSSGFWESPPISPALTSISPPSIMLSNELDGDLDMFKLTAYASSAEHRRHSSGPPPAHPRIHEASVLNSLKDLSRTRTPSNSEDGADKEAAPVRVERVTTSPTATYPPANTLSEVSTSQYSSSIFEIKLTVVPLNGCVVSMGLSGDLCNIYVSLRPFSKDEDGQLIEKESVMNLPLYELENDIQTLAFSVSLPMQRMSNDPVCDIFEVKSLNQWSPAESPFWLHYEAQTRNEQGECTCKFHSTDWPKDCMLAAGDEDGIIYVWSKRYGITMREWTGHDKVVNAVSWNSRHKGLLVTGSDDGEVRFWR